MHDTVEVAVIGAGQGGLTVSYLLKKAEVPHVVLERGGVGESWRTSEGLEAEHIRRDVLSAEGI